MYKTASTYTHTQTLPAASWLIEHNIGGYPVVDVFVQNAGSTVKLLPKEVIFNNPMSCTITFTLPQAGFAVVS